ncbi:cytochrome P460 family protein [Thiohalobacter sp. IOR34]|uniref:cytochrome P460 family protein n=1 Tax=Thiohalobacter sp. IOR34 TaxID=3057176 RepID=UPI0025B0FA5C|nr:cytochrome P460 family protein [Thiohalobacter sp. IOR34]WJW75172.1 cytochrome P460 family protein [Thiohalobacter sp. IOR34]
MLRFRLLPWAAILLGLGTAAPAAATGVAPAPNGIELPAGYRDWQLIGSSHRTDNNSLRVILGNPVAVAAARKGRIRPWPDGTILAKLVWKDARHPEWPAATIPGRFVHAEFMIKDSAKYQATGGWGFARWLGQEQRPYGKDSGFEQECFGCHQPVKDQDYVFTRPVTLP